MVRNKRVVVTKLAAQPRMPLGVVLRVFVVGSVAIGASAYAIYRHYWVPRPSMLRPTPSDAGAAGAARPGPPDLLPAPELLPLAPGEER